MLDEPFLPWADPASYTLVPNGTVEATRKWSLDGAESVAGNENFYVNAKDDRTALRLPAETVDALRRLGVERIGQVAAMPRAQLARRFGGDVRNR